MTRIDLSHNSYTTIHGKCPQCGTDFSLNVTSEGDISACDCMLYAISTQCTGEWPNRTIRITVPEECLEPLVGTFDPITFKEWIEKQKHTPWKLRQDFATKVSSLCDIRRHGHVSE